MSFPLNYHPFPRFRAGTNHYLSSLLSFSLFSPKRSNSFLSHFLSLEFEIQGLILGFSSRFGKQNPFSLWLFHFFLLKSWISYTNSIIFVLELRIFKGFSKCSWVEHFSSSTLIYWKHTKWVHTPTFSRFLKFLRGECKLKYLEHNYIFLTAFIRKVSLHSRTVLDIINIFVWKTVLGVSSTSS